MIINYLFLIPYLNYEIISWYSNLGDKINIKSCDKARYSAIKLWIGISG